ncbi:ATP-dependent endonuclease [Vibrio splendidus]
MIESIKLLFGNNAKSDVLSLEVAPINIFVGPNNSGKSLFLKEIEQLCNNPEPNRKIISEIKVKEFKKNEILGMIQSKEIEKPENHRHYDDHVFTQKLDLFNENNTRVNQVSLVEIIDFVEGRNQNYDYFAEYFLSLYTIRLDGKTRFSLTEEKPSGDLTKSPKNQLMALFQDDNARKTIRDITYGAIGKYFVIDPTGMTSLRIKMSDSEPSGVLEQGLSDESRTFHSNATDISEMSDGVKAFTGLVSATLSQDYKILLVDEPEAFLHPPLAKKLGKTLSILTKEKENKIFISTHSSDFVMGCIQSGQNVNITRLTYSNGVATARSLSSQTLYEMMKNPLLRSTGILSAMFHEGVIVSESDADRAFYQEINERLNYFTNDGAKDSLFINAQNKQTIGRIVAPLRNMGIPAVAIVDLDIIKKSNEFKELCKSCNVPQALLTSWGMLRGEINKIFEDNDINSNKQGVDDIPQEHRATLESLLNNLCEYGIFAVPRGALEQWLPILQIASNRHGPNWIMEAFEKMGEDPSSSEYLQPTNEDVWVFMRNIAKWLNEPSRKGV